jgi:outer membrane protein assembly factor BamD (BamD/ComL family)
MNKLLKLSLACIITLAAPLYVFSQDASAALGRGIDAYKQSDFRAAAATFRSLAESSSGGVKGSAGFWLAKTQLALGSYDEAAANLEYFMKNYPDNPYFPEAFYERGRLLYYQKEYDSAITAFGNFLSRYPESEYAANAYFWTGESLFALGNLDPAEKMFTTVFTRYPTSARVEAAKYRTALIGQKYREEELLKLLKWSHEEYLKSLESKTNLEKTYSEIVSSYQRQILALNTGDLHDEVLRLSEQNRILRSELEMQKSAGTSEALGDAEYEGRMRMLAAREEALKTREAYLNQLIAIYEEKK